MQKKKRKLRGVYEQRVSGRKLYVCFFFHDYAFLAKKLDKGFMPAVLALANLR